MSPAVRRLTKDTSTRTMKPRRRAVRIGVGTVLTLLGTLWLLQGADIIRIQPILCVANCRPITGGSLGWGVVGALTLIGGVAVLFGARRRR